MDFSVETFIASKTGAVKEKIPEFTTESYDGYSDGVYEALQRSEEQLNFLDTFTKLDEKNTSDKINMLKRIAKSYNKKTVSNLVISSLEAFIERSIEEERGDNEPAGNNNQVQKPQDQANDQKNSSIKDKAKNMLITILKAIEKFIQSVGTFFKRIFDAFKEFLNKHLRKYKVDDMVVASEYKLGDGDLIIDFGSQYKLANVTNIINHAQNVNNLLSKAQSPNNIDEIKNSESFKALESIPDNDVEILKNVFNFAVTDKNNFLKRVNVANVYNFLEKYDSIEAPLKNQFKTNTLVYKNIENKSRQLQNSEQTENGLNMDQVKEMTKILQTQIKKIQKVMAVGNKIVISARKAIEPKNSNKKPVENNQQPNNQPQNNNTNQNQNNN